MPLVNQFQEEQLPTQIAPAERRLTAAEFQTLADVPPETEWFANIKNPHTKRAYKMQSLISCVSPASRVPRNSAL